MAFNKIKEKLEKVFNEAAAKFSRHPTHTLPSPQFSNFRLENGTVMLDVKWKDIPVPKDEYQEALKTCPYIKAAKDIDVLCKERIEDWESRIKVSENMSAYEKITSNTLSRALIGIGLIEIRASKMNNQAPTIVSVSP